MNETPRCIICGCADPTELAPIAYQHREPQKCINQMLVDHRSKASNAKESE